MVTMGRPRQRHKDLPVGLHRDGAGRITLKVFTEEHRVRNKGLWTRSFKRDLVAARIAWAEVYGFRELNSAAAAGTLAELMDRFEREDLIRMIPGKTGKPPRPKYAPRTQKEYKRQGKLLRRRYGAMRYAPSEAVAARGGYFRTMDVSAHIRSAEAAGKGPQGNRDAAYLGSVFRYAKECGLTEYNPCLGASRHRETPRDREVDDALFLDLYRHADPFLKVWMDLVHQVGSRISDVLNMLESDWVEGVGLKAIPGKVKRGQARVKQLFLRTDDLAETIERAKSLKLAALTRIARRDKKPRMASIYLLPNPETCQPYTLSGFESKFSRARVLLARERLGETATAEQVNTFVRELDVHMHDGRSKAGDDAEARGEDMADFLGHTDKSQTARRVYRRRVIELNPNPKVKAR